MSPLEPIVLEGRHARLEPLTLSHAEALAAAASGPRDTYGFTWVPDGELSARKYIQAILDGHADGTALPFATIDLARGEVVGATRFLNIQYWDWPERNDNQRGEELPDAAEIGGTWLSAAAQRTPINTEAKLLMLTHAFETWRVHRVSLATDARNSRSREAIARIGAAFDGVIRGDRAGSDGSVRDTAFFSILEAEWPGVKCAPRALAPLTERVC